MIPRLGLRRSNRVSSTKRWKIAPAIDEAPRKRRRLQDYDHLPQQLHPEDTTNAIFNQEYHGQTIPAGSNEAYASFDRPSDSNSYGQCFGFTEEAERNRECCYGMLSNIPLRLKISANAFESHWKKLPVIFDFNGVLTSPNESDNYAFEIACQSSLKILNDLKSTAEIYTQLYCHANSEFSQTGNTRRNGTRRRKMHQTWFLNIILYGPALLEETIGDYFNQHHMYLQDPLSCDRRVPYRNPHIIQPEIDHVIMTDEIDASIGNLEIERLEVGPDLLARFMEDEKPLHETEAPPIIKTALFLHQKQALTFMLHRERGWALEKDSRDIWTKHSATIYRNNVSGACLNEPPPTFQGGLLADDMGLGKTLSMICLIASNQANGLLLSPTIASEPVGLIKPQLKATLLIVPPPLIQSWEKQFQTHICRGSLRIYVYHGQSRKTLRSLEDYDVVITTYHTVSSIWRKRNEDQSIFTLLWHRIVLDEAHIIQNSQSQLAEACCALQSSRKWAITGTPIQNKLTDFASIVKFLHVYPYSKQEIFDEDISRPWRRGDPQGFLRLKTLVRAITISRTKAVVNLPTREDFIYHLDFSNDERRVYEDAKKQTVILLHDVNLNAYEGGRIINALQRLNILRLICSHGLLIQSHRPNEIVQSHQGTAATFFQTGTSPLCDSELLMGSSICANCGADLVEDLLESSPSTTHDHWKTTSNQTLNACENCISQSQGNGTKLWDPVEHLDVPEAPVSQSPSPAFEDDESTLPTEFMSTKIKALVKDLIDYQSIEKCVVFSYWTYSLDLVQMMLKNNDIKYTRIDGKTSLRKRTSALRSFEKDDSLRVILVSITCGGAGLDLTAASRVYLLEPHWNPMIEEQALCRVHRVGQQRNVTTIRYLMRDSFEEQVVEIQKRKKMLANVTFGHDPLGDNGIGLGTLQVFQ